ncbi:MAG TPA: methyltransferase domain-containing protein [Pyrinomonadaceae bacterium]|nr:methyltransferase domain-containing protein [Pyrinomonadaceae bacterium]
MKHKLINYLRCPSCAGSILLAAVNRSEGDEIMEGQLTCDSCASAFPIVRGIPRFAMPDEVAADIAATAENFGWQWQHFVQADELYADQFLGWIEPVKKEFFDGKLVLEGGCGKGRHTQLAAQWGAREVIGVDLSDAVETAFAATRKLENAHIVQADIYHLPFPRLFDYAFSVGVLHHLPDPQAGFRSLAAKVKAGGYLSAWVYGAENNQWITRFIDPLREKFSSRIDRRLLLQLSKLPTALVYVATKCVYGPLNRVNGGLGLSRHLFYNDYLSAISAFGWREQHTIVFDHLVAPTSHYIRREDFEQWWHDIGATEVVIGWHNKNSWRGFGKI